MKIIVGQNRSDIEEHAKKVLRAIAAYELRHPRAENIVPRGIPTHAARFPVVCDDCGDTFWANDPYASHRKCSKGRERIGF